MILYDGPSVLDQKPILVIATFNSKNPKLKNTVQVWIIRKDIAPLMATKTGDDYSICGNCPQRRYNDGGCYVNIGQAPQSIFRAYERGSYEDWSHCPDQWEHSPLAGQKIRFGAYGDPAAAPSWVWQHLAHLASAHTGYTHQMKHSNFDPEILDYCMASTESPKQSRDSVRHFRVRPQGSPLLAGEIDCPQECTACMLCDGSSDTTRPSVSIEAHGSLHKRIKMVAA